MDKAAVQYQKALEVKPDYVPARLALARLALKDEDFGAAEKYLSKAVADGGGTAEVHLNLGVAYRGLGQVDKALAEYDAAQKLEPKLAPVYLNRGIILQRYKDAPDQSLELYKQYVRSPVGSQHCPPTLRSSRSGERRSSWWPPSRRPRLRAADPTLQHAQKLQQQRLRDAEAARRLPRSATPPAKEAQRTSCRRVWSSEWSTRVQVFRWPSVI